MANLNSTQQRRRLSRKSPAMRARLSGTMSPQVFAWCSEGCHSAPLSRFARLLILRIERTDGEGFFSFPKPGLQRHITRDQAPTIGCDQCVSNRIQPQSSRTRDVDRCGEAGCLRTTFGERRGTAGRPMNSMAGPLMMPKSGSRMARAHGYWGHSGNLSSTAELTAGKRNLSTI